MNKRTLAVSEAVGCVVIYAAAVFLHFFYRLSGGSPLSILYGAVNESVWEHTKIFSAGYVGYALLQLCWIKVPFKRYVVAKCAGLYFLMLAMIGFFYLYTAVTGRNITIVADAAVAVLSDVFLVHRLPSEARAVPRSDKLRLRADRPLTGSCII